MSGNLTVPRYFTCDVSFQNLSAKTTTKWGNTLHCKVVHGTPAMHPLNKFLSARIANLVLAPASILPCIVDTAAGIVVGAASIVSLGMVEKVVNFAVRELHATNDLLSKPYEFLLKAVNPKAEFCEPDISKTPSIRKAINENPFVKRVGRFAQEQAQSKSWLIKHVGSRCAYAGMGIIAIVSKVVFAALAVIAVPLSLVTLGRWTQINQFASLCLRAPGVISDLFICVVKVINPWAGENDAAHHVNLATRYKVQLDKISRLAWPQGTKRRDNSWDETKTYDLVKGNNVQASNAKVFINSLRHFINTCEVSEKVRKEQRKILQEIETDILAQKKQKPQ